MNIKLIKLYYLGKEENCVEVDKNSFDIFEKLWSLTKRTHAEIVVDYVDTMSANSLTTQTQQ